MCSASSGPQISRIENKMDSIQIYIGNVSESHLLCYAGAFWVLLKDETGTHITAIFELNLSSRIAAKSAIFVQKRIDMRRKPCGRRSEGDPPTLDTTPISSKRSFLSKRIPFVLQGNTGKMRVFDRKLLFPGRVRARGNGGIWTPKPSFQKMGVRVSWDGESQDYSDFSIAISDR